MIVIDITSFEAIASAVLVSVVVPVMTYRNSNIRVGGTD